MGTVKVASLFVSSIDVLPAGIADLVDEDYLSPIVVLTKDRWTRGSHKLGIFLGSDIIQYKYSRAGTEYQTDIEYFIYTHVDPPDYITHESTNRYLSKYGFTSYFIVADTDALTHELLVLLIEELNKVKCKTIIGLAVGNINIHFKYVLFEELAEERWNQLQERLYGKP